MALAGHQPVPFAAAGWVADGCWVVGAASVGAGTVSFLYLQKPPGMGALGAVIERAENPEGSNRGPLLKRANLHDRQQAAAQHD